MSSLKINKMNQAITYPDDNRLCSTEAFRKVGNVKREEKIALKSLLGRLTPQEGKKRQIRSVA